MGREAMGIGMANAEASAPAPRVSVVVIFYNSERFFVEAIESVLAQDFSDFELILADDGSSDGSTEIARDYARRHPGRVRYVEHPGHANHGMSPTRNLGVSASQGELIAFLDSDDVWRPNKLREQVAILDRYPEVDLVCGTARYWRSWNGGPDKMVKSGHRQGQPIPAPEALVSVYPLTKEKAPSPSDLLVRRSAYEAVGGFENSFTSTMQLYEDQAFLTKMYLDHTVYFADEVWIDYRLHDGQSLAQPRDPGIYDQVRSRFLDWLEARVRRSDRRFDPRVRMTIARAALPYRHPWLSRLVRSRRTLLKNLRGR